MWHDTAWRSRSASTANRCRPRTRGADAARATPSECTRRAGDPCRRPRLRAIDRSCHLRSVENECDSRADAPSPGKNPARTPLRRRRGARARRALELRHRARAEFAQASARAGSTSTREGAATDAKSTDARSRPSARGRLLERRRRRRVGDEDRRLVASSTASASSSLGCGAAPVAQARARRRPRARCAAAAPTTRTPVVVAELEHAVQGDLGLLRVEALRLLLDVELAAARD